MKPQKQPSEALNRRNLLFQAFHLKVSSEMDNGSFKEKLSSWDVLNHAPSLTIHQKDQIPKIGGHTFWINGVKNG